MIAGTSGYESRFGDRQFYRDWWNSTTLGYFWRSWNLPVHAWMVAHVYLPLTHRGWRKSTASLLIFFISAALHELVVSIPFWNFKLLAFGGMMAQVPPNPSPSPPLSSEPWSHISLLGTPTEASREGGTGACLGTACVVACRSRMPGYH